MLAAKGPAIMVEKSTIRIPVSGGAITFGMVGKFVTKSGLR